MVRLGFLACSLQGGDDEGRREECRRHPRLAPVVPLRRAAAEGMLDRDTHHTGGDVCEVGGMMSAAKDALGPTPPARSSGLKIISPAPRETEVDDAAGGTCRQSMTVRSAGDETPRITLTPSGAVKGSRASSSVPPTSRWVIMVGMMLTLFTRRTSSWSAFLAS